MNVFLSICIPSRLLIVLLATVASGGWLRAMAAVALCQAAGFLLLYAFGLRKTAFETQYRPIWWNHLRPAHGILHLLFAVCALKGLPFAPVLLLADVFLGLFAYLRLREKNVR